MRFDPRQGLAPFDVCPERLLWSRSTARSHRCAGRDAMSRGETRFHPTAVFPCKSGDDDDPPAVARAAHKVLPMPNHHLCSREAHGSTARSAPIETTELRWFRNGPLPRLVCSWFTSNGACGAVEERHDRYLMDGRLDRGLKLRGGSTLELKVRQTIARTVPSSDGPDAAGEEMTVLDHTGRRLLRHRDRRARRWISRGWVPCLRCTRAAPQSTRRHRCRLGSARLRGTTPVPIVGVRRLVWLPRMARAANR